MGRGEGQGRTYFSKSRFLYPSRLGALLPVHHRRTGRVCTVFRNDKRKREQERAAARCHGLSDRSFGCTGTHRIPRGLFLAQRVCKRHGPDWQSPRHPRKPSRPTRVTAYGNVRAMIKAPRRPDCFTAITAVKSAVNEPPPGQPAVCVTVIR